MLHASVVWQIGQWLTTTQSGVGAAGIGAAELAAGGAEWNTTVTVDTSVLLQTPYMGLLTAFPTNFTNGLGEGDAAEEYVDGSYARLPISGAGFWEWGDPTFASGTPTSNVLQNQGAVEFAERASATSSTVVGWAVWDQESGGSWLYSLQIDSVVITQYDTLRFAAGTLNLTVK